MDYNRCGTRSSSWITEPDLRTPEEARAPVHGEAAPHLPDHRYTDCSMEKGSMRCDG